MVPVLNVELLNTELETYVTIHEANGKPRQDMFSTDVHAIFCQQPSASHFV
jgi:hypothetical protein